MTSLIKRRLLPEFGGAGEYVIQSDPIQRVGRPLAQRREKLSAHDIAKDILTRAREEADALLANAAAEAEALRAAAFQEARDQAALEIEAERTAILERAKQLEAEVAEQIEKFWAELEPEVLKLSVKVAEKIIRHEVDRTSDVVVDNIKTAILQLRDKRDMRIRVNPDDRAAVTERKDEIAAISDSLGDIEVCADRRIARGGCVIDSANGSLDARMETQLNEAEKALMEAMSDGG